MVIVTLTRREIVMPDQPLKFQKDLRVIIANARAFAEAFITYTKVIGQNGPVLVATDLVTTLLGEMGEFVVLSQPPLPRRMDRRACELVAALMGVTNTQLEILKIVRIDERQHGLLVQHGQRSLVMIQKFVKKYENE